MNFKGTSVVTIIFGDYEYIASVVDGRVSGQYSLVPEESFTRVIKGNIKKIFKIGEDHIATVAGWGNYCVTAIEEIQRIYSDKTHGLSMKEIVEQVQQFCVKKWVEDPEGGIDKEFPASVVVYGLDGEYILSPTPEKVKCESGILDGFDTEAMNGKKVKIVYHGHGGHFACEHMFHISRRISSKPIETMFCMMEAMGASAIQDPPTGGFFLGATLTKTEEGRPKAIIYNGKDFRPHFCEVLATRYECLQHYLSYSLLLVTAESYFEKPNEEGKLEKSLKDMFLEALDPIGEKLVSITLVGVRKGKTTLRLLNFSSVEARKISEPLLMNIGQLFYLPSKEVFEDLALGFVDPKECL